MGYILCSVYANKNREYNLYDLKRLSHVQAEIKLHLTELNLVVFPLSSYTSLPE